MEPRLTVTSLLRPLFCGPAKRPYISLKKPRLMRSPVIHDQRTHFKIPNSRISCHFTPLIRPLVQNLENLNVLCHYGPQVMKFEPAPIIRSPLEYRQFFGPIDDRINGVPLYDKTVTKFVHFLIRLFTCKSPAEGRLLIFISSTLLLMDKSKGIINNK